jgi:hypothetical protein
MVERGAGLKGSSRESMCQAAIRILRATAALAELRTAADVEVELVPGFVSRQACWAASTAAQPSSRDPDLPGSRAGLDDRGGASVLNEAGGRIAFRFHARDVNLVLGPRMPGISIPFRVLVDGEPPGDAHGLDVDEAGNGTVVRQRLYQLIREPGSITDRTFEIAFLEPGVEGCVFTFG